MNRGRRKQREHFLTILRADSIDDSNLKAARYGVVGGGSGLDRGRSEPELVMKMRTHTYLNVKVATDGSSSSHVFALM
jgi:hypothetical protein